MVGITGLSLPILEDSYFAWFNNACSLCHFPLPCTSVKQLDVNCDVVFFRAIFAGEDDSLVRQGMPSEIDLSELHDWIGRKCVWTQRSTPVREDIARGGFA